MIATNRSCLSQDELRQVLAGRLPADEFGSAISHLDDCDNCRTLADTIETEDSQRSDPLGKSFAASLANPTDDPLQVETACQVALWRLLDSSQLSSQPSSDSKINLASQLPCQTLGPYQLTGTLGTGGMGTVYLAKHDRLKRLCAIKLLPPERVDQPGWLDRFDREMTTVAALEHPNVVRATDAGHQDGWHYLVMEYLDGLDVGRIASRMNSIEVSDACEIVRQAALGLAHIHDAGLVHRDIKPSNLMLCRDGQVKILDLGLVLAGDDPLSKDDRLTTVGHLMGTLPYMAPEQLADCRDVDPRADIYSLGATLFRLIAGRPPHQRHQSLAAQILAISNNDAPALDTVCQDADLNVDRGVVDLVSRMLSRDRDQRPATAADVADSLQAFASDSHLKGLLRKSLRRTNRDNESPSLRPSISMTRPPGSQSGGFNGWLSRHWLMGGMCVAGFLLAAIVFKIQTDKGELVVHSEHSGLTVVIKQDQHVVDRLVIDHTGDHRTVLRKGSYRVEIEGGGQPLQLSSDVVTIGRRQDTRLSVLPNTNVHNQPIATRLYQGQPLEHWMSMLQREQDVDAIGRAMEAVERLTRNIDSEIGRSNRRRAATETLKLVRQLGGFTSAGRPNQFSSSDAEPSGRFMGYFLDVFPQYFADPGLELINQELQNGTDHSKYAVVWALHNFVGGIFDSSEQPNARVAAQRKIYHFSQTPDGRGMCESVIGRLQSIDFDANTEYTKSSRKLADDCILQLTLSSKMSILENDRLVSQIRDGINEAANDWRARKAAGHVEFQNPLSYTRTETIAASVQLGKRDSEGFPWDYLCFWLVTDYSFDHQVAKEDQRDIFATIIDKEPEVLLATIDQRLAEMLQSAIEIKESAGDQLQAAGGMMMGGAFGGGTVAPDLIELTGNKTTWSMLLPFYAQNCPTPSASFDLLTKIHSEMKRHQIERFVQLSTATPYDLIDAAITTLESRRPEPKPRRSRTNRGNERE